MTQIVRNAIKTPDGTILESRHRHDYQSHIDAITGETYVVDAGHAYFRGSANKVKPEYLHVTTDDPFEVQREAFAWGSRGKTGESHLKYIKLSEMDLEHIKAILITQDKIKGTYVEDLFKQEIEYRKNINRKANLEI